MSTGHKRDDATPSQIVELETPAPLEEEIQTTGVEVDPSPVPIDVNQNDVGLYVANPIGATDPKLKLKILEFPYIPDASYDYKADGRQKDRVFRHAWLNDFSTWLVYSPVMKGPLCKFCVLFRQHVDRGVQGAFIRVPCWKYKDFGLAARKHIETSWHKQSLSDAKMFISSLNHPENSIVSTINRNNQNLISENRAKLAPIVSTIIFCGSNDLALRGKTNESGNFRELLNFRMEAGDEILRNHLETSDKNSLYTSAQVEHEIIESCEKVLCQDIANEVNCSFGFSVLADETSDLSGVEQLSIGVRYSDKSSESDSIHEEFVGFVNLEACDAETIANAIISKLKSLNLDMSKLIGQGFDGCSTMAGHVAGVQAKIANLYPKAMFTHCASHRLNLVVNDLNTVAQVRNTVSSIKAIIVFFRESPKRRKLVPAVPLFCETRWTAKYKSIRIFYGSFIKICDALSALSADSSRKTANDANALSNTACSSTFIVCLVIIAKYSSQLEPVTQSLQSVQLDTMKVYQHVQNLISMFEDQRTYAEREFSKLWSEAEQHAEELNVTLTAPRVCGRQKNRTNVVTDSAEEYFRISIYIPYMDSMISSLKSRFNDDSKLSFVFHLLHPKNMVSLGKDEFVSQVAKVGERYEIENLKSEVDTWYEMWCSPHREVPSPTSYGNDLQSLLPHVPQVIYPGIRKAVHIALALPTTTCSIERIFSTLRRVKTWLRTTMTHQRLSGLCMLSVHRAKVNRNKAEFIAKIIDEFASKPRRMKLLFAKD